MAVNKELLKEVTIELWKSVRKLRPELDKETRLQLVLKALITIGDLPDHVEAAMVVGVCAEMEISDMEDSNPAESNKVSSSIDSSSGRKVVRRSSAK